MRAGRRVWVLAALVPALAVAVAPAASADGDPASDVLLTQDSFLPYSPPVQPRLKTALERVLARARAAGFPIKVALILSAGDLGSYASLLGKPQEYADVLSSELGSLNPHGEAVRAVRLLVVMPGGYGGNNLGDRVDDALEPVAIQGEAQSDGLARAAVAAVARLATVNGHPVDVPPEARMKLAGGDAATDPGGASPLVFAAPAVLLFIGLALAGRIARRKESSTGSAEDS